MTSFIFHSLLFFDLLRVLTMLLHSFIHLLLCRSFKVKKISWVRLQQNIVVNQKSSLLRPSSWKLLSCVSVFVSPHPLFLALFNTLPFFLHNITSHLLKSTLPSFHFLSFGLHNELSFPPLPHQTSCLIFQLQWNFFFRW